MNYFVKMLLLAGDTPTLLFGFCAPTEQPARDWERKDINEKMKLIQYTTIFSEEDKKVLISAMRSKFDFHVGECALSFGLELRPPVLSDTLGLKWENNNPVLKLHTVNEYWNLDKIGLMKRIHNVFSNHSGCEFRNQMRQLLSCLKRECGIDFSVDGGRIGNFELYEPGKYIDDFEIRGNKEDRNSTITIYKKQSIDDNLVVNCAFESEGRWTNDEINFFSPNAMELSFRASEPISHYRVKIWEQGSGSLVYAEESSCIMEIPLVIESIGASYIVRDSWTEELRKSSNHEKKILEIENHAKSSRETINVNPYNPFSFRMAKRKGEDLCKIYKICKTKGAYIPHTDNKIGEIDSFQKVRMYLEENGVSKVILADPFFSVKSASKLLGRISHTDLELNVITSLTTKDPDTGDASPDMENECKTFLQNNKNMLHENLVIKNVLRGNNQAFHDRYLVRYFSDGRIDGFLLSNSLNSAGQSFPFVVAPLEKEVCLEVDDYLRNLTDSTYQKTLHKNKRVDVKVLFDGKREAAAAISHEEHHKKLTLPFMLSSKTELEGAIKECIALKFFDKDSDAKNFTVEKEALPRIFSILLSRWDSEPEAVFVSLGEAMCHSYHGAIFAKEYLKDKPDVLLKYISNISELAERMELRQNHHHQPVQGDQYVCWAILSGKAQPSKVAYWFNRLFHVFYKQDGYLACLYELLFYIAPEKFLQTMEKTSSPLMLSMLITFLALGIKFDYELYKLLLSSQNAWLRDLGAEWMLRSYCDDTNVDLKKFLESLDPCLQLEQSVYLLSETTFRARTLRERKQKEQVSPLRDYLIGNVTRLCNEDAIPAEKKEASLKKLEDCEDASNAILKLSVAKLLNDEASKNILLDQIINTFESKIANENLSPFQQDNDQKFIEYVVEGMTLRYGEQFSPKLSWEALDDYSEPYLQDRDFNRWHRAQVIVGWNVELLKRYRSNGFSLMDKMQKYLDIANAVMNED